MHAPLIVPFTEHSPELAPLLGGKAASLHRLTAAGAPVPAGFTVTVASFRTWVEQAGEADALDALGRELGRAGGERVVAERGRALAARLADRPLTPELVDELVVRLDELPEASRVAVRSSGVLEDTEEHSFAGLYESFLDVVPAKLASRLRACWLSLFSGRVLCYMAARRLRPERLELAVAVQRMVPCEHAGVLFSVHPLTGREDEVLVELVPGLGERLVSGEVDPSRLELREEREGEYRLAGAEWRDAVPPGEREALVARVTGKLLPRVRELELAEGRPLDVEFGLVGDAVHLLQARPITRLSFAEELGEWTSADFNEGGVSAGVCSPFMWSLYDLIWQHHLPEYLRRIGLFDDGREVAWGRVFFGIPYWNVGAVKRCLRVVPGFSERDFDEDLGIEKDYGGEPHVTPVTPGRVLRALVVLVRLYREFARQRRTTERFLAGFDRLEASYLEVDPAACSDEVLFARYRTLLLEDYFRVEGTYFLTIFNSSNAKLEFKSAFDALSSRMQVPLSYLDLMSGMKGLRTLASAHDLHRLCQVLRRHPQTLQLFRETTPEELESRYRQRRPGDPLEEVAGYITRHAHHSRRELDPRVPRWGEDEGFVLEKVRQALLEFDPARAPEAVEERQHRRYLAERARAERAAGWNLPLRWLFTSALERSRVYCWLREEARDRSTRLYRVIRLHTLELARRLVARGVLAVEEDVFLLPYTDLLAITEGRLDTPVTRRRVEEHRRYLARFERFRPPRDIGAGLTAGAAPGADAEGMLRGVGGAPGRVRGTVKVVRNLEESGKLAWGAGLVAEYTDPGWTPLLTLAGAVVTEVGGVLSHAAVISREYGVPAVLSVRGATRALEDGMLVEVDGHAGTVRVVEDAGEGAA